MNSSKIIVALIIVFLLAGGAFYYFKSQNKTEESVEKPAQQQMEQTSASPEPVMASDSASETGVKEFTVTGSSFKFEPNVLTVNKGDKVKVTFKNSGGFHDFAIDGYNVKTKQIASGATDTVEFTADKAGTFEFYCSVGQHRQMGMKGTLTVK